MSQRRDGGALLRHRRGFTLVEVLMVMLVLVILAGVSVPIYAGVTRRAEASRVLADVRVIDQSLREHLFRESAYPPTAPRGEVPAELVPYLPEGFRFRHGIAEYRYRNWAPAGASGGTPRVGVEIHSPDQVFLRALAGIAQGRATLVSGSSLTLVLD